MLLCFGNLFAQKPLLSHSSFKIVPIETMAKYDSIGFHASPDSVNLALWHTLYIRFNRSNISAIDNLLYLNVGRQSRAELFELRGNKWQPIGKTGSLVYLKERSLPKDANAIVFGNAQNLLLKIDNYSIQNNVVKPLLFNKIEYQLSIANVEKTFFNTYSMPLYFGILLLVLLIAIIQYVTLPERAIVYYIFYLLFIILRSANAIELLIIEDFMPFLSKIGFKSGFSQQLGLLSMIFYILFVREFTGFPIKKPKLDLIFKIQLVFIVCFMVFDCFYPVEKYINPTINSAFRIFESIGALLGLSSVLILIKVYDAFNKYIIWGTFALVFIAIVGQEVLIRFFITSRESQEASLSILWSIAYLVEVFFFTIALVNRQKILTQSLRFQEERNKTLLEELAASKAIKTLMAEDKTDYETFSLATSQGILVFQQADIIRLEASGSYTIFFIQNQKQQLASYTLAEFEPKLNPEKFIRIHKSHLVNLSFISKYNRGDGGSVILTDKNEIPVSRSRKDELLKKLFPAS